MMRNFLQVLSRLDNPAKPRNTALAQNRRRYLSSYCQSKKTNDPLIAKEKLPDLSLLNSSQADFKTMRKIEMLFESREIDPAQRCEPGG